MKKLITILLLLPFALHAQVIKHQFYTIHFDSAAHGPDYTEYWLTKAHLKHTVKRPASFTNDPQIDKADQGTNALYSNSGFDKGHLSPADDFRFSAIAEDESMYFTNLAPQNPYFNEHLWEAVEEHARQEAAIYDSVYVITGVLYGDQTLKKGKVWVSIPTYYWKEIKYNGCEEYFVGRNEKPISNDINSIKVDAKTFNKLCGNF